MWQKCTKKSLRILDELRGFKHVFRHAYSYGLDAERAIMLAKKPSGSRKFFRGL